MCSPRRNKKRLDLSDAFEGALMESCDVIGLQMHPLKDVAPELRHSDNLSEQRINLHVPESSVSVFSM